MKRPTKSRFVTGSIEGIRITVPDSNFIEQAKITPLPKPFVGKSVIGVGFWVLSAYRKLGDYRRFLAKARPEGDFK